MVRVANLQPTNEFMLHSSRACVTGSPHARLATAAAGALSAAAATCGPTLEPHLDRFLSALFGAAASPRPEVAAAAHQALAGEQADPSVPLRQHDSRLWR